MNDQWINSIIPRTRFKEIDKWVHTMLLKSGAADPLAPIDYCVTARKYDDTNLEILFSPNCFQRLCEKQPLFGAFDTRVVTIQELIDKTKTPSFVFWFGNVRYYLDTFEAEQAGY